MESEKYVAIEITSNEIRLLIGFVLDGKIQVIDLLKQDCSGLVDGMVNDVEEVSKALKELKIKAEKNNGMKIDSCYLVVPPLGLLATNNQGRTCTINASSVESIDIANVLAIAEKVNLSSDLVVIDTIPLLYILNNNEQYKLPPLYKPASEISVWAKIYAISNTVLQGYKDVLFKANIRVNNFVATPLAAACYFQANEQFPKNYLVLNIGGEITNLAYIKNQVEVESNICYRFGSKMINEALMKKLNLSSEDAETYKKIYGLDTNPEFNFKLNQGVTLSSLNKEIIEVMTPTLNKVVKEIDLISKREDCSLTLYLVGGGCKLKGLKEHLNSLGVETQVPVVQAIGARDITYISLLGTMMYAYKKNRFVNKKEDKKVEVGLVRMK